MATTAKRKRRKLLCPGCKDECLCRGRRLRYVKSYDTDWYGRLSYYKCSCCKTTFVSRSGASLEVAAFQM